MPLQHRVGAVGAAERAAALGLDRDDVGLAVVEAGDFRRIQRRSLPLRLFPVDARRGPFAPGQRGGEFHHGAFPLPRDAVFGPGQLKDPLRVERIARPAQDHRRRRERAQETDHLHAVADQFVVVRAAVDVVEIADADADQFGTECGDPFRDLLAVLLRPERHRVELLHLVSGSGQRPGDHAHAERIDRIRVGTEIGGRKQNAHPVTPPCPSGGGSAAVHGRCRRLPLFSSRPDRAWPS